MLRPSEPNVLVSKGEGDKLRNYNVKLLKKCKFDSIQAAVNASGNNDRIVDHAGCLHGAASRSAPTNDPKCDGLEETNDRGRTGALSYRYQVQCPNDQNLILVAGRAISNTPAPQPPLNDRHGLPDEGACIRCNLQIEGSGVTPDDVIVDAGNVAAGNKGPANPVKDVVFRIDRADGFVARNMNVRHATEHGFYVMETDGYVFDHFKAFYNEDYGVLGFTSDHGVISDCDVAGSGDSAIYPGAAPETGEETREGSQRYNTEITRCDMHHSTSGYSGTAANGVWIHHNDLYDNANGFTTDVFTAAGHPGFPQDSDLIENNEFYSNNFNPYLPGSDVVPTVPMPVGTGMWIAGGNNNIVRNNRFYDNWRRGAMLFAVPNSFVGGCGTPSAPDCQTADFDTSYRNRFYGNIMGVAANGAVMPNGYNPDPTVAGPTSGGTRTGYEPPGNSANCWFSQHRQGEHRRRASRSSRPTCPPTATTVRAAPGPNAQIAELLACLEDRPDLHLVPDPAQAEPIAGATSEARRRDHRGRARGRCRPGCGTDDREEPGALGGPTLDAPVELANCTDWNDGSVDERLGTIAQIENFVGGPVRDGRSDGRHARSRRRLRPDGGLLRRASTRAASASTSSTRATPPSAAAARRSAGALGPP